VYPRKSNLSSGSLQTRVFVSRSLVGQMTSIIAPVDRYLMVRLDPRSDVLTLGIAERPVDPPFFYVG
jgi:hypothetical protein